MFRHQGFDNCMHSRSVTFQTCSPRIILNHSRYLLVFNFKSTDPILKLTETLHHTHPGIFQNLAANSSLRPYSKFHSKTLSRN